MSATEAQLTYRTDHGAARTAVEVVIRRTRRGRSARFRLPEFHPAGGYLPGQTVALDLDPQDPASAPLHLVGTVRRVDRRRDPHAADDLETWPAGVHAHDFEVSPTLEPWPDSWAQGRDELLVEIAWTGLTGRRLLPA